jgi:hypothetical protein
MASRSHPKSMTLSGREKSISAMTYLSPGQSSTMFQPLPPILSSSTCWTSSAAPACSRTRRPANWFQRRRPVMKFGAMSLASSDFAMSKCLCRMAPMSLRIFIARPNKVYIRSSQIADPMAALSTTIPFVTTPISKRTKKWKNAISSVIPTDSCSKIMKA